MKNLRILMLCTLLIFVSFIHAEVNINMETDKVFITFQSQSLQDPIGCVYVEDEYLIKLTTENISSGRVSADKDKLLGKLDDINQFTITIFIGGYRDEGNVKITDAGEFKYSGENNFEYLGKPEIDFKLKKFVMKKFKELREIRKMIEEENMQWTAGINPIFMLTEKEFQRMLSITPPPVPPDVPKRKIQGNTTYRSSLDWCDKDGQNWVTPIKNQGGCGSCWAFAAGGQVEALVNISENDPNIDLDVAEQTWVTDCCSGCGDCGGGWHYLALEYMQDTGVPLESCDPYTQSNGPCDRCADWLSQARKITSYSQVTYYSQNQSAIKNALQNNPVSTTVYADATFQSYTGGIYSYSGPSYSINHAIVFVGWNDSLDYWKIKNSWGTGWGENGYMRAKRGENNNLGYFTYDASYDPLYVDAGPDTSMTAGETITLTPTVTDGAPNYAQTPPDNYTYLWSPSTGLSDPTAKNPEASPAQTTMYTLTATDLNVSKSDSLLITVSGSNQPYPVYSHAQIMSGGDDIISPGESVDATIWVKNTGLQNAYSVYGILSSSDPYVSSITTDSSYFGDINAGDSVPGNPDYEFDVSNYAEDQHTLTFDLITHDVNDSTVTSNPSFTVFAPYIVYVTHIIDDSQGNNDGIWDAGEEVNISLTIQNDGHLDASSVTAELQTGDSYVTINDGNATYPDISQGSSGNNSSNPFNLTSDPGTPLGHEATFNVIFTYNGGMIDTVTFNEIIGVEGVDWANHDIGNTELTVTRYGAIGFMSDAQSEGDGWFYPINGSNGLFIGSFAAGTGTDWVADRFYSSPSGEKNDWETTSSPDGMLRMGIGGYSEQNSSARFVDSGHSSPRGLEVEQFGWAWDGNQPLAGDDFVILKYIIHNTSSSTINNVYFGIFMDLDVGSYTSNIGGVDEDRSMVFVLESGGSTYYGIRALEDSLSGNRRASLIYNSDDVYPWSGMPDSLMFCFMDGSLHRDTSGTYGADDYGANACVGPMSISPGETDTAGFALIGGSSLSELQINSDTAFAYYWKWYSGAKEKPAPETYSFNSASILTGRGIRLSYSVPERAKVKFSIFDCTGREIKRIRQVREAGFYEIVIPMKNTPSGVYLVKMEAGSKRFVKKAVLIK